MVFGRDEQGRFTVTVSDREILQVFATAADPVLTTGEVAAGLEDMGVQITTEGVRYRLNQLEANGLVRHKRFGARAVGWWAECAPEETS